LPELPDVEGFRRVLAKHAVGKPIRRVEVRDRGALRGASAAQLARTLRGRHFRRPERHGKWLIARTDGKAVLLFHFGMTGSLWWRRAGQPEQSYDRIVFALGRGELRYKDLRKLHGVRFARDEAAVDSIVSRLGPDALGVSRSRFDQCLAGRGRLKARLADQSVIAGLGNLLIDEICWRARVNPLRKGSELSGDERKRMYGQMRRVLRDSVRVGYVPGRPSWITGQRDKRDAACPRCRTKLARARVNGRMTIWCPRCQPRSGAMRRARRQRRDHAQA
jgi:formamidopyrimidine-DNA glycosylase